MKIEIGNSKPEYFRECWPGQYEIFSHFEFAGGVPSVLFIITTLKENGMPNACLHAWSAFSGDGGGFYAIMPGLLQHTHTYKNILRDKEFCINFLNADYYDNCLKTIEHNDEEADELFVGGFTAEPSKIVKPPRIHEAFLSYECTLESCTDLSNSGISSLIIGKVQHMAIDEGHSCISRISGKGGFMLNIHSPKDPKTGEGKQSAISSLNIEKLINE
jgi:flavin reductase (DIM6/NTAB) family NADH-FMN oxidoreductase RutF